MVSEVEKVRLRTKLEMKPRSRTIDSTSIVHKNSLYKLFLTILCKRKGQIPVVKFCFQNMSHSASIKKKPKSHTIILKTFNTV